MVTIAVYSRLEDAQRDADKLAVRGIAVSIVYGGAGAIIPGTGPSIELQVDSKDLSKLEEEEDELKEEILAERAYACPKCGSKDYYSRESILDSINDFVLMALGKARQMRGSLRFRCRQCGINFRINSSD